MKYQEHIVTHQIDTIARHIVFICDTLLSRLRGREIRDPKVKEVVVNTLNECKAVCTLDSFYVYIDRDSFIIDLNFKGVGNIQIKTNLWNSTSIYGETLYVSSPLDKYIDGIVFNRINKILYLDSFYYNPYQIHDLSVDNLIEWKDSNMDSVARKRFLEFIKKISKEERHSIIVKNANLDGVTEGIFGYEQYKTLSEIHNEVDSVMDQLGQPVNYLVVPSNDWKPLFEIYSQKMHLITSDETPHPMMIDEWVKSLLCQEVCDYGLGALSEEDYKSNIKRIYDFFGKNYGLQKGEIRNWQIKILENNYKLPMLRGVERHPEFYCGYRWW